MKRAILRVSTSLLQAMLVRPGQTIAPTTFRVIEGNIPQDAQVVGTYYNDKGILCLILESADFAYVDEGQPYPFLDPPEFEIVTDPELLRTELA